METAPPIVTPGLRNWRRRNPTWFGVLLGLGAILGLIGIFVPFLHVIMGFMKSSDAYTGAVARARAAPAVLAALGTPIEEGYFVTGKVKITGPSGWANLAIPVSGPKGKATIFVEATKRHGEWHFDYLVLRIDGSHKEIDLTRTPESAISLPPPK